MPSWSKLSRKAKVKRSAGAWAASFVNSTDPLELLSSEGWTFGEGVEEVDGALVFNPAFGPEVSQPVAAQYQDQNLPLYVTIVVDSITTGYLDFGEQITEPGTYRIPQAFADASFSFFGVSTDAVVSLVSLKLLNDNQLGDELVTNGDFASATGWAVTDDGGSNPSPAWTISGGKASIAGLSAGGILTNTSATVQVDAMYKLTFDVLANDSGSISVVTSSNGSLSPIEVNDTGAQVQYFISPASSSLSFYAGYADTQIDNVSLKKYTLPEE